MANFKNVAYKNIPEICKSCMNLEFDSQDEYSPNYYFCTKGLFLPTKNNKCKVKNKVANND